MCVYGCVFSPEQMSQFLHPTAPQQVGQSVEIPNIELVVQRAAEAHADEVGREQDKNNLWESVREHWTIDQVNTY